MLRFPAAALRAASSFTAALQRPVWTGASQPASLPPPLLPRFDEFPLFVKKAGDTKWAPLSVKSNLLVGFVKKEIVKELGLSERVTTLGLYVADKDGRLLDPKPLDSTKTLEEAISTAAKNEGMHFLVIKEVAAPMSKKQWSAEWTQAVESAAAARSLLARSSFLRCSRSCITADEAKAMGITVLLAEDNNNVALGLATLPALAENMIGFPKGFTGREQQNFFVQTQRQELVAEFLSSMHAPKESRGTVHGVLLSGPNGVGKSGVGLQTFLACFAQGLPVVYISSAQQWVSAAHRGEGDRFFLEHLVTQNADLIAADALLKAVLDPILLGDSLDNGVFSTVMKDLQAVLRRKPGPAVGVIVDEAQHITQALAASATANASPQDKAAGFFFQPWHNWQGIANVFVRMDIACNHGLRELQLPSGEDNRLRFVVPWSRAAMTAAATHKASPFAMTKRKAAMLHAVKVGGGIPRALKIAKEFLQAVAADLKLIDKAETLYLVEVELTSIMKEWCERWWNGLDRDEQVKAAEQLLPLIRKELLYSDFKSMYDAGLVAIVSPRMKMAVVPVSDSAFSIICGVLAPRIKDGFLPLHAYTDPKVRGAQFERQIQMLLLSTTKLHQVPLPATQLHSGKAPYVDASSGRKALIQGTWPAVKKAWEAAQTSDANALAASLAAAGVADLAADPTHRTLHVPASGEFPCGALSVPSATAARNEPIIVWEPSIIDPRDSERVGKVEPWFEADGLIPLLRALYPSRPIICALCWSEDLTPTKHRSYEVLNKKAAVSLVVIGRSSLLGLGVKF